MKQNEYAKDKFVEYVFILDVEGGQIGINILFGDKKNDINNLNYQLNCKL